jgi:hypothetical protein
MFGGLHVHFIVYVASAYGKILAWRGARDSGSEPPAGVGQP